MEILKGAKVSQQIKEQVQGMVASLNGHVPVAAIIRVGERPDDISYESSVKKKIAAFGMEARSYVFPDDIPDEDFRKAFSAINQDEQIDGILVLCPLPKQIDGTWYKQEMNPRKDLDGISPWNVAKVFSGETNAIAPCTAEAVMEILHAYEIPIQGKQVVIVGRSMVVGRPVSMLFLKEHATVTICHSKTEDLKAVCRKADILVAAIGRAGMLNADYVAEDGVVIDVGINVDEEGNLCGDMIWEGLEQRAAAATPVPGGVGAVTTAILCRHLAEAALKQRK